MQLENFHAHDDSLNNILGLKTVNSTHGKNIAHCSCSHFVKINNRSIYISYTNYNAVK